MFIQNLTLGLDENIKNKEKIEIIRISKKWNYYQLLKNHIFWLFAEGRNSNLLTSDDLKDKINKNEILDGYVVPLLASKDKNTLFAKVSAANIKWIWQLLIYLQNHKILNWN